MTLRDLQTVPVSFSIFCCCCLPPLFAMFLLSQSTVQGRRGARRASGTSLSFDVQPSMEASSVVFLQSRSNIGRGSYVSCCKLAAVFVIEYVRWWRSGGRGKMREIRANVVRSEKTELGGRRKRLKGRIKRTSAHLFRPVYTYTL